MFNYSPLFFPRCHFSFNLCTQPPSHSGLFPLLFVFVLSLISLFFFFNLTSVCFSLAALAFFSSYLLGLRCALFSFRVTPSPPVFLVSSGFSFWEELSLPNLRTLVILWCQFKIVIHLGISQGFPHYVRSKCVCVCTRMCENTCMCV